MELPGITVQFRGHACKVLVHRYATTGNLMLQLMNMDGTIPMATATINLPGHKLPDTHVLIKDYSENTGMVQALEDAGVIGDDAIKWSKDPGMAFVFVPDLPRGRRHSLL